MHNKYNKMFYVIRMKNLYNKLLKIEKYRYIIYLKFYNCLQYTEFIVASAYKTHIITQY